MAVVTGLSCTRFQLAVQANVPTAMGTDCSVAPRAWTLRELTAHRRPWGGYRGVRLRRPARSGPPLAWRAFIRRWKRHLQRPFGWQTRRRAVLRGSLRPGVPVLLPRLRRGALVCSGAIARGRLRAGSCVPLPGRDGTFGPRQAVARAGEQDGGAV